MNRRKYSDIEDFLEDIASMQELYIYTDNDKLDRVINQLSSLELTEDDLKWVAAAQADIKIPNYIKNKKT